MSKHKDIHGDRLNISIEEGHLWIEGTEKERRTYLAFTLEQADAVLKDLEEQLSIPRQQARPNEDGDIGQKIASYLQPQIDKTNERMDKQSDAVDGRMSHLIKRIEALEERLHQEHINAREYEEHWGKWVANIIERLLELEKNHLTTEEQIDNLNEKMKLVEERIEGCTQSIGHSSNRISKLEAIDWHLAHRPIPTPFFESEKLGLTNMNCTAERIEVD